MERPLAASPTGEIVVDHISSEGPTVTHMRGLMVVSSLSNLRAAGLFPRYQDSLPAAHRDGILYAIASSWVPVELALAHYHTIDRLNLGPAEVRNLGALMAQKVAESILSVALRTLRDAGVSTIWRLLAQQDRVWDRMYQGGGVTVLKTGPKDVVLENHGLPLLESRYFRAAHVAYLHAVSSLFTKVVFTKQVRAREPHPHRIAIAGSWV